MRYVQIKVLCECWLLAAVVTVGLAAPANAIDDNANCLGEDRSVQGGFASGDAFAQAIVSQHGFDRLGGFPASFGRSLSGVASSDCGLAP